MNISVYLNFIMIFYDFLSFPFFPSINPTSSPFNHFSGDVYFLIVIIIVLYATNQFLS
ncbi:hypothetical protein C1646_708586 [Rhizophagus diaphanus]|nr:hypothetical protein C1646_708586 [Rhizophagus diaphanus] [Rhizophagus sp. MUCL 43196]